ncbi:hypothetical protein K1719_047117 [Acacia pycnantha]|nr:hypothetical protein K1719_047117 [Acacia pycnantha]
MVRYGCKIMNPDEIYDVLNHNRGSDAIQGISLDLSQIRDLQLSADTFKKMTNLRFLKFHSSWGQRSCTINLPSRLDSFCKSLRYLQWDNFLSESLALSFCAEKLVELYMPNSHLKKLWDGVQNLVNLRKINLRGSKYLMELPDISTAQNLEGLYLGRCEILSNIDPSILSLPRLYEVSVEDCRSLRSLKTKGMSKSISNIYFGGCSRLKDFSFSSNKIGMLHLDSLPIEILDFPIGHMEELQDFSLDCSKLKNPPIDDMICCMRSLTRLHLCDSGGMIDKSKLHTLFDSLLSLQSISLSGACKLTELPHNIKHLLRLLSLDISNCKSLQSLPELPPSIRELHARNCTSLKTLQVTSHIESSLLEDEMMLGSMLYASYDLKNLEKLTLSGCEQLYELPESIGSLFSLRSLDLRGSNIEFLPISIKHLLYLNDIQLSNCRRLRTLPELPFFIRHVVANGCISLEIVSTLATAPHLTSLVLKDCLKLENFYMESSSFSLKEAIYKTEACEFCYPGRKVPEWFKYNQGVDASNNISIELPSTTTDLIGFVLCSVLSHQAHAYLQCQLYYDGKHHTCSQFEGKMTNFDSHHVFLWCVSDFFINFGKTMDDQNTNYRPNLSFEFSVITSNDEFVDGVIEACGVCPIYASEYRKFIQQMELAANLSAQKETCQDADENSFHGIIKYANFSLKTGKCGHLEVSNIPKWFTYKSSMIDHFSSLYARVHIAPDFDKLMGFIFYFVIPNFSSKERDQCYSRFWVHLESEEYYDTCSSDLSGWHYSMIKLNSDNVFLWYDPFRSECILKCLRQLRQDKGLDAKFDLKFSFQLGYGLIDERWEIWIDNCLIKEYGVCPICVLMSMSCYFCWPS